MRTTTVNPDRQLASDCSRHEARETESQRLHNEDLAAIEGYLKELRFQPDRLVFNGMLRMYTPMQEAINFFEEDGYVMRREFIELFARLYETDDQAKSILYPYFARKLDQSRNW